MKATQKEVGILIRHDLDRFCLILALVGDLLRGVRMSGEDRNIRENEEVVCVYDGQWAVFGYFIPFYQQQTAENLNEHCVS